MFFQNDLFCCITDLQVNSYPKRVFPTLKHAIPNDITTMKKISSALAIADLYQKYFTFKKF